MGMKTKRLDDCINRIKKCKTLESIARLDVISEKRFLMDYLPSLTSDESLKYLITINIDNILGDIEEQAECVKMNINKIVSDTLWEAEDIFHSKVEELTIYLRELEKELSE